MSRNVISNNGVKKIFTLIKNKFFTIENNVISWNGLIFVVCRQGKFVWFHIHSGELSSNLVANTKYNIGNIPTSSRPENQLVKVISLTGDPITAMFNVETNGDIFFTPYHNINKSSTLLISETWITK